MRASVTPPGPRGAARCLTVADPIANALGLPLDVWVTVRRSGPWAAAVGRVAPVCGGRAAGRLGPNHMDEAASRLEQAGANDQPSDEEFEFIVRASVACTANALALAGESLLLHEHGHFARALALAVACAEEDGKGTMLLRLTTSFDRKFMEELGGRSHPTTSHVEKQAEALRSIDRIYAPFKKPDQGLANVLGGDAAAQRLRDDMHAQRERSLYVDASPGSIETPLRHVTREVAAPYVQIARTVQDARAWILNTPLETLLAFLREYRGLFLGFDGVGVEERLHQSQDPGVFAEFQAKALKNWEFVQDPPGTLHSIRRRG